jgi:hypothetical protein
MDGPVLLIVFAGKMILGAGGTLGDVIVQFLLLGVFVIGIVVLVAVSAAYDKSPTFGGGVLDLTVRKIAFLAKENTVAPAVDEDLVKEVEIKSEAPAVRPGFSSIERSQVFNDLAVAESVLRGAW